MLGYWDPFADLNAAQDRWLSQRNGSFRPPVDVYEAGDDVRIDVELPGIKPEDIKVNVEGDVLTITGERKRESVAKKDGYQRVERTYGTFTRAFGYRGARDLLASGAQFTALFAATDMVAAGALQALRERGVSVPDDIAVAGYDDIPLAIDVYPTLTTVSIPHEELGRTAVRLALHRDEFPDSQHQVLGTHIVLRDSTRRSGR